MESEEPTEHGSQIKGDPAVEARALVEQMVDAGEWPEPALMEQIVAAGNAAVPALLEVLQTRPSGWPAEAPLCHALGLVSMLHPPEALPLLVELARYYKEETGEEVADALAAFGAVGVESLVELIRQPSIRGYHRLYLIGSAVTAAGDDLALKSAVAETIREVLAQAVIKYRTDLQRFREDPAIGEREGLFEDSNEIYPSDEIAFLIAHLSDLADPLALQTIEAAFDANLVSLEIINPASVKRLYEEGGLVQEPKPNWLNDYRESFANKERPEPEPEPSTPDRFAFPSRSSYPSFERKSPQPPPPPVQPVVTIRHAAPKIGRNDPCWCGSGKKYKKCHLGKDAPK